MGAPHQVDPQAVIARLSAQLGSLCAEIAMRDVALDQAQQHIADLEALAADRPDPAP